ncbi:glycoside hydrolase family 43 protein [Arachidicoccus sp.]|uniref:glycoside hydrolase family 43 protein n=1 Tax=Arachidicoccus sp. TaxID=1872624 RepID=UPI003D1EEB2A
MELITLPKKGIIRILSFVLFFSMAFFESKGQNPIIQTIFTADPAPMVYHDTVFLYTSHDEASAPEGSGGFRMRDWRCFTSTDMVNWTDHGAIASLKDFKWGPQENGAWAPQCIERNGKFYLYCPLHGKGIGVLVSDSPYGPFRDPLGKGLIDTEPIWNNIDPTVFIDSDGQAYLYWGNPDLYFVKLNGDMISYSGAVNKLSSKPQNYQEGPWFYKRKQHYYLAYASTCCPEGIGYAMSDSPTGPWVYKGYVMAPTPKSSGNHPGIIDYKGHSYVFGFNYELNYRLTSKHHERRSVCVEEFTYNADGTIPELPWWTDPGVKQIGTLDPYNRVEAETIAFSEGVKTEKNTAYQKKEADQVFVTSINNGDYIKVQGANFSKGASSVQVNVAALHGGKIDIHTDRIDGPLLGVVEVKASGEEDSWRTITTPVKNIKGVHDLFLVFKGNKDLFNFDWWKFNQGAK